MEFNVLLDKARIAALRFLDAEEGVKRQMVRGKTPRDLVLDSLHHCVENIHHKNLALLECIRALEDDQE